MNAYKWLLGKLNRKFIKIQLFILAAIAACLFFVGKNDMIMSYGLATVGYLVMVNELYYQKYMDNNCISLYILQNDIKGTIMKYLFNMISLIIFPIGLMTLYAGIYTKGVDCIMILLLLFWACSLNNMLVFLKFIINAKQVKRIEFFLLVATSAFGVLNIVLGYIAIFVMFFLLCIVWGVIFVCDKKINKERVARLIL